MINYKFGNIECKISFDDFLSLTINNVRKYKSDFKQFSELYEFIEKNKKLISHVLFDGYEYILEKGLLHNLYGPAIIKHCDDKSAYFRGTTKYFYIDGKCVFNQLDGRGCKKLEDFQNKDIFHFQELTGKKSEKDEITGKMYRRKEGVDYKKIYINLEERIKKDQRKKKLLQINDNRENIRL